MNNSKAEEFTIDINLVQPSQLYINRDKLEKIQLEYEQTGKLKTIPIKKLNQEIIFTDGHTRAFYANSIGLSEILVEWDEDELDWEMYEICVNWCKKENIFSIKDLNSRVISNEQYKKDWLLRCSNLSDELSSTKKSIHQ